MGVSKKAIEVLVPRLLFGVGAPAWSASAEQAAPATVQMAPANPYGNTLLGMLSSVLTATDPSPRQPKNQRKAGQLYSQHDVVGDPEACITGQYTIGNGAAAPGVP